MGVKFFDFDNDGRMDLFISDMHSDMMQDLDPFHEKDKITKPRAEHFLGAPAANSFSGTRFITIWEKASYGSVGSTRPWRRLLALGVSTGD